MFGAPEQAALDSDGAEVFLSGNVRAALLLLIGTQPSTHPVYPGWFVSAGCLNPVSVSVSFAKLQANDPN